MNKGPELLTSWSRGDTYLSQAEEVAAQPLERLQLSDSMPSLSTKLTALSGPRIVENPEN